MLARAASCVDACMRPWGQHSALADVERMLVMKFWGVGNWALLRPIVQDLRDTWPDRRLTVVTLESNRPLVEDLADDLLFISSRSSALAARDGLRAVAWLRRHTHQVALDFEPFAHVGALLARAGGVPQRIGFAVGGRARERLYTATVPWRDDLHAARAFRNIAEVAGLPQAAVRLGGLASVPAADTVLDRTWGAARRQGYVVLHPGSGDNFPGRRWSAAGFAALGRAAMARGRAVFVTGGEGERALVADVVARVGGGAIDVAGRLDLPGLVALLGGAHALVANDTGPVHLASQMGVPVLALYGPNTPALYGPLSPGSVALYRGLACSPCLTPASYRSSRCRLPTCMASIGVGSAQQALEKMLRLPRAVPS